MASCIVDRYAAIDGVTVMVVVAFAANLPQTGFVPQAAAQHQRDENPGNPKHPHWGGRSHV
jgi:hypothetical protein